MPTPAPAAAYEAMPAFFAQPAEAKQRLHASCCRRELLADGSADAWRNGRYAGWGSDSGREWLQLRQYLPRAGENARRSPMAASGVATLPDRSPEAFTHVFGQLRRASAICLGALARGSGVDEAAWMRLTDLG